MSANRNYTFLILKETLKSSEIHSPHCCTTKKLRAVHYEIGASQILPLDIGWLVFQWISKYSEKYPQKYFVNIFYSYYLFYYLMS